MQRSHLSQKSSPIGRGFSLIEAAIVLGVIGLVIGGIWAAAAQVSFTRQRATYYESFLVLKVNIQKNFTQTMAPDPSNWLRYSNPTLWQIVSPKQWEMIDTTPNKFVRPELIIDSDPDGTIFVHAYTTVLNYDICRQLQKFIEARKDPDFYVFAGSCTPWNNGSLSIRFNVPRRS